MSPKRPERNWHLRITDMYENNCRILKLTNNVSWIEFSQNEALVLATTRCFEIMGEAASKVPKEIQEKFPEIEWQLIISFRNKLIHEYFGVDNKIIYNTAKIYVPLLLAKLENLKNKENI